MTLGHPAGARDRGAQPERTALAWSRTALALIGAGLLCVRLAPSSPGAGAAALVVCGGVVLLLRRARTGLRTRRHRLAAGGPVADPASVLAATALTMLLGVAGALFTLH